MSINQDYEQRKYYAARDIRDRRYQPTKSSKGQKCWLEWWEEMFKDDYQAYAESMGIFEMDGRVKYGEALRLRRIKQQRIKNGS